MDGCLARYRALLQELERQAGNAARRNKPTRTESDRCSCPTCGVRADLAALPCGHRLCSVCQARCLPCAACRPPRRWTREQAIGWLVTSYWSDWEIEEASQASDPVAYLRERARDSARGCTGPHLPRYETWAGTVRFWDPGDRWGGPPAFEITARELARETLQRLGIVPQGRGLVQPRLL